MEVCLRKKWMEWLRSYHFIVFCLFTFQLLFVSFVSIWVTKLINITWVGTFWLTLFLEMFLAKSGMPKYLSITIVSAKRGAKFDLETPSRLLLDAITTRIIVHCFDDSVCFSVSSETLTGFSVIALVGRPFKAECRGHSNISFTFRLTF